MPTKEYFLTHERCIYCYNNSVTFFGDLELCDKCWTHLNYYWVLELEKLNKRLERKR